MQLLSKVISRDANIYQIGDIHKGTRFHHEKGFSKTIERIKNDPKSYVVIVGDLVEAIAIDDPRYDSDTNTQPIPFKQAEDTVEILKPIKNKIITILDGNHELKIKKHVNLCAYVAKQLGTHYGTWTCKIDFKDSKNKPLFKAFFCHGHIRRAVIQSNAGDPLQRKVGEQAALKRMLYAQAGDVVYMGCGHYHKLIVAPPMSELYLMDNGSEIKQSYTAHSASDYIHPDLRWYGCSGAFYKQYELGVNSYSEIAGYRPTEMGYLILRVENGRLSKVEDVKV